MRDSDDRDGSRGAAASAREVPDGGLSAAIASFREARLLRACIGSVLPQCESVGAELVVARAGDPGDLEAWREEFPTVRFLAAPPGSSIPVLRGVALAAASGAVVALTEDHCVAASGWLERLAETVRAGAPVVGGAMGNARTERLVDWAAYFAEYGLFAGCDDSGTPPSPTEANVAYAGAIVPAIAAWTRSGLWENVVHDRLRARGVGFAFRADAIVLQNHTYRFGAFCRDRFTHGRAYARRRLAEGSTVSRWLLAAGTPVLPFLLLSRVARRARRSHRGPFLRAGPLTLAFLSAWALGEAAGYLAGPALSGGGS
ncbi:MAG: glycosyltransferase [Gemmatimonadota bacterium]